MAERQSASVEDVREAQEHFKNGSNLHEKKEFKEAIEAFKKAASICPFEEKHLEDLQNKLKGGGYKLQHESIAYMGCAAVHLSGLVRELTDEEKQQVPVDEKLSEVFREWE